MGLSSPPVEEENLIATRSENIESIPSSNVREHTAIGITRGVFVYYARCGRRANALRDPHDLTVGP